MDSIQRATRKSTCVTQQGNETYEGLPDKEQSVCALIGRFTDDSGDRAFATSRRKQTVDAREAERRYCGFYRCVQARLPNCSLRRSKWEAVPEPASPCHKPRAAIFGFWGCAIGG